VPSWSAVSSHARSKPVSAFERQFGFRLRGSRIGQRDAPACATTGGRTAPPVDGGGSSSSVSQLARTASALSEDFHRVSIEVIARVLHHSRASGTTKLVLVGIANHCGDGGAYPSVATLMKYAGVSERTVQNALRDLKELGELIVAKNRGGSKNLDNGRRPNLYTVRVECPAGCDGTTNHKMPTVSTGAAECTPAVQNPVDPGVKPAAPKPSSEPPTEPSTGDSENHSGLGSSRLDDFQSSAKIPRPRRKAKAKRVLTPEQLQVSWQNFLRMNLGDLDDDVKVRGAAFLELQFDHGAIEPDKWAQRMIDKGEWDGFVAGFGLGSNRQAVWTDKNKSA
jgi:hypothetical protein